MLVAEESVARHDIGAALAFMLVVGAVEDVVERLDFALGAAAALQIDDRVVLKISPVTITSARRKTTMLSPSVMAFGS